MEHVTNTSHPGLLIGEFRLVIALSRIVSYLIVVFCMVSPSHMVVSYRIVLVGLRSPERSAPSCRPHTLRPSELQRHAVHERNARLRLRGRSVRLPVEQQVLRGDVEARESQLRRVRLQRRHQGPPAQGEPTARTTRVSGGVTCASGQGVVSE